MQRDIKVAVFVNYWLSNPAQTAAPASWIAPTPCKAARGRRCVCAGVCVLGACTVYR